MQLISLKECLANNVDLDDATYVGTYKNKKALIEIINKIIIRIVLEDATHFFGDSLYMVMPDDLYLYVNWITPAAENELGWTIKEKQRVIDEQWKQINKYAADEDKCKREARYAENYAKEKIQRHKAQLRSVFYMLERLEKVGTHHEKEVVIRYIRECLYEMIKGDRLDQYGAPDDLPF